MRLNDLVHSLGKSYNKKLCEVESTNAVHNMANLLNPGGKLILTFPYREDEFVPNVYELSNDYSKGASYICKMFSRKELMLWESSTNLRIIDQQYWSVFSGEYWGQGQRNSPPVKSTETKKHDLTCICLAKTD